MSSTTSITISSDELKEKMFCFVYDSRNQKESIKRAEYLCDKLKEKFPSFNVGAFVNNDGKFPWAVVNCKVSAYFENYEGDILLVLF